MSKIGKVFIVVAVTLPILFIVATVVNWFVYPFSSAKPNFADVEAVYNKMAVPATWVKKAEGSNRGIAGRQCPIESDGCFSKVGTFRVPINTKEDEVKKALESLGCISVLADRTEQRGGATYTDFECSADGTFPWGTLTEEGVDGWNLTIGVSSR